VKKKHNKPKTQFVFSAGASGGLESSQSEANE
jgi:hypothetical protein